MPEKLYGTDISVMSAIEEHGPISFEDLCYDESSKKVMTKVLEKLLRLGYIKKDKNDKYI
jgi:predicted transcriptional regulator